MRCNALIVMSMVRSTLLQGAGVTGVEGHALSYRCCGGQGSAVSTWSLHCCVAAALWGTHRVRYCRCGSERRAALAWEMTTCCFFEWLFLAIPFLLGELVISCVLFVGHEG